jgi:large subunit ribosomal protein L25
MKTVSLSGSLRANVGKTDAAALRVKGLVPCVLYGGKDQVHFYADERAFKPIIFTPNVSIVDVQLEGGKSYKAILQAAQYHKITDRLIHADFLEVVDGKAITVELPVKLSGQSEGVKKGGKLTLKMRKLKVKGLASELPEYIELNIDNLDIGQSITVGDVNIKGVTTLNAKNVTVVGVSATRATAAADEPAKAAPAKAAAAKK